MCELSSGSCMCESVYHKTFTDTIDQIITDMSVHATCFYVCMKSSIA